MRSVGRSLSVIGIVIALTVLAGSSALAAWPKSVYLVKNCAGGVPPCLVTSSTLKVLRGTTFNYLAPALLGTTGSPMLITTPDTRGVRSGTADGLCHFYMALGTGHCEFAGGTGSLSGFHMNVAVLFIGGGPNFSLTGTYWFDRGNGDDD